MNSNKNNTITKQLIILLLNGMMFIGFSLITYGVISYFRNDPWKTLDSIADFLSQALTILGIALVACSAYFPSHTRQSDKISKFVVAPFVLFLVVAVTIWWAINSYKLPAHIFNGFSILGIAGSILRALPFSEWEEYNDNMQR